MTGLPPSTIESDTDAVAVAEVRAEIFARIRRLGVSPREFFGDVIRRAIDEVLSLGAKRYSIKQLDPPEQAYIGMRVEMLVRDGLDVGKGIQADALIAGHEVDLKWSKSLSWMIGPENLGTVCLGLGMSGKDSEFSVGLFVPREAGVRKGANRDKKISLTAAFRREGVNWLIETAPTPPNFIEKLDPAIREEILTQPSAQRRLKKLAELVPETPIPRSAIVFVSLNKDDPLRRVRVDKSRKMPPLGDMVCLSQKYGKKALVRLGVELPKNHFYFVQRSKIGVPT
ncbi:MAG: naeIR [Gemmatimonadetes bacterium]|nr:naeIR [Gemmatimonadota bacterium]